MTIASFAPANTSFLSASATSENIAIPSGGTVAVVTNLGQGPAFLALGTSSSLSVTVQGGLPVLPGQQTALTIGANTTLAAVTLNGLAGLVITSGS